METKEASYSEITLSEILFLLKRYKVFIISLPVTFSILAFIVVSQIPSVWEGSVKVQIGRVGQLIETSAQASERITSWLFADNVLKRAQIDSENEKNLFKKSLSSSKVSNTNMEVVEIKLRSHSPEIARRLLHESSELLQAEHRRIMISMDVLLKEKIKLVDRDLLEVHDEIESLKKLLYKSKEMTAADVMVKVILFEQHKEKRKLEGEKFALQQSLGLEPPSPSMQVSDIFVSPEAVSPKKPRILFLAFLFGFCCAVAVVYVHYSLKQKST